MKNLLLIVFALLATMQMTYAQDEINSKSNLSYVAQLQAGYLSGNAFSQTFQIKNGVSFNNRFIASIGLGMERYFYQPYLPIVLDFRYNILKKNTTPFVSVSSGYLQSLPRNYGNIGFRGGFTAGGKIGISHFITDHFGIETSIGYRYSDVKQNYGWYEIAILPYDYKTELHRFELSVGLIFK
jgi:hypothetical protein